MDNLDYIKDELNKYFAGINEGKIPFRVLHRNTNENITCLYCNAYNCEKCEFNLPKGYTIHRYITEKEGISIRYAQFDFEIIWTDMKRKEACISKNTSKMSNYDSITLEDCLVHFSVEETLEEENKWYCSVCGDHKMA
jgi:hypothetical protein